MQYREYSVKLKASRLREAAISYQLDSSAAVQQFCVKVLHMDMDLQERVVVIMRDVKGKMIGYQEVSIGGLASTYCDPKDVFRAALLVPAHSIIVVHNHPSGDATPSDEDMKTLDRLASCGDMLNVPLVDYMIIGRKQYYSKSYGGVLLSVD